MHGRARFLFLLGLAACGSREERIAEIADEIGTIASKSSCSSYSWEDRSVAPLGYITGMGVAFAKSLCRQIAGDELAQTLAAAKTSDDGADALSWYASSFDAQGLEVAKKGPEALRALYTLGIGLGMRESSGKYCEGYDTTVGSQTANTAEAGLFQTSFDSSNADPALKALIAEYEDDDEACLRETFAKEVSCSSREIVGSGDGAAFQRLAKSCPVFAAEYAMTTLRVLRAHYGPINRKEAEVNPACGAYLRDVQSYVAADRDRVCGSLHPAD